MLVLLASALALEVSWTGAVGHAANPTWSPDGGWLAFEVNNNANKVDLFLVQVLGGVPKVPTRLVIPGASSSFSGGAGYAANPNWHPKGPLLFEGANAGGLTRIYYLQPGGSSPSEYLSLASAPGNLSWPTVSPDGARLAYVSGASGQGDVYVFDVASGKSTLTSASPAPENAPRFAPDSRGLVFSRNLGNEELYTWSGSGSSLTPLLGGAGDQSRPRYAGAANVVYFTNERGDDLWDLAVSPATPGKTRLVLGRDIRLPLRSQPALTPDGGWVLYASAAPSQDGFVFATRLDGGETRKIETGLVAVGDPSVASVGGRLYLAFTALPGTDSDWRQLHVLDITGKL